MARERPSDGNSPLETNATMRSAGSRKELIEGVLLIVGALAAHRFVARMLDVSDRRAWRYAFGTGFIVAGAVVIWRREVPVGIAGRPPSHTSRGSAAVLLGVLVIALGVAIIVLMDDASL